MGRKRIEQTRTDPQASTSYEPVSEAAADSPASGQRGKSGQLEQPLQVRRPEPVPGERLLFRGRDPQRLEFGTSGLRGLVRDLTDLEAYVSTRGFLNYLVATGEARPGCSVPLAGDLRPSTHSEHRSIMQAVARAVTDSGFDVLYCGRLPTPALSFFAFQNGYPSIMVTGSHIPFDRNGIKFQRCHGEVLKEDEVALGWHIEHARNVEYERPIQQSLFADDGMFLAGVAPQLGAPTVEPRQRYVARNLSFFPTDALKGLRLVVFEHSAVGRELLVDVLRALGAEVHPLGRSDDFTALDTEAISDSQLATLQRLADHVRHTHGPVDAILSTDGDSDRPLVAGLDADGKVRFFGGDLVGLVTALYLNADGAAVPVSATDAIELALPPSTRVVRTRIGSPHVVAAMATLTGLRPVGWEANGGFLTGATIERQGASLQALPTRDALLPILSVLHAARLRNISLVELFATLPQRFGQADLLDQVPSSLSRELMALCRPDLPDLREVVYDTAVLWSDTFGVIHAADANLRLTLLLIRSALAEHFKEQEFSSIRRIDYLDGIRVHFTNEEVVHLRPSGNAPQLRVYALASSEARVKHLVRLSAGPAGIATRMLEHARHMAFVRTIEANLALTRTLLDAGAGPKLLATVSGSATAQRFWQGKLEGAREEFRANHLLSFHEDLPVNQAFGVLLAWQRLRQHFVKGEGALAAFVFGEGTRATPFTETDNGQKPALESFVRRAVRPGEGSAPYLSMVELAMRHFASVEAYLRRSGFDGVVFKWGDELLIPSCALTGSSARFAGADIVRFVSMQTVSEDTALNKDWVGVDASGKITSFIPRRPLERMYALADMGLMDRDGSALVAGINLGSIAVSRMLLDALLGEFSLEVNDVCANRSARPDLDPQFFAALVIAAGDVNGSCAQIWRSATLEVPALAKLDRDMPGLLTRLLGVLSRFRAQHGRSARLVAMDFGEVYWGDVGQHQQILAFYMALNERGPTGRIARSLAGIELPRDAAGNIIDGSSRLGPKVLVENSVLIDCDVASGTVVDSVLIGTRASTVQARGAFDVQSTVGELCLEPRAGTYKVVHPGRVLARAGERVTTLFMGEEAVLMRVDETTDLKDRKHNYDVPILGNSMSFADAHMAMSALSSEALLEARGRATGAVLNSLGKYCARRSG